MDLRAAFVTPLPALRASPKLGGDAPAPFLECLAALPLLDTLGLLLPPLLDILGLLPPLLDILGLLLPPLFDTLGLLLPPLFDTLGLLLPPLLLFLLLDILEIAPLRRQTRL